MDGINLQALIEIDLSICRDDWITSDAPHHSVIQNGGRPYRLTKPFGLFCFLSPSAFEQARRVLLKKQNLRYRGGFVSLCVGTTRFELATPCTPCKCATGL